MRLDTIKMPCQSKLWITDIYRIAYKQFDSPCTVSLGLHGPNYHNALSVGDWLWFFAASVLAKPERKMRLLQLMRLQLQNQC